MPKNNTTTLFLFYFRQELFLLELHYMLLFFILEFEKRVVNIFQSLYLFHHKFYDVLSWEYIQHFHLIYSP